MSVNWRQRFIAIATILFTISQFCNYQAQAASGGSSLKDAVDDLNSDLGKKKKRVDEIRGLINNYADRIKSQDEQKLTLENQLVLLENRIKEKELRIEEAKAQIEVLTLELQSLDYSIKIQEGKITTQKTLISDLVRRIRQSDDVNAMHVLLSRSSLSSYFDQVEEVQDLQGDLSQSMNRVIQEKTTLEQDMASRENKRLAMEEQKINLTNEQNRLELEKNSLLSLLAETNSKQEEFSRVLDELRQQQQETSDDIASLEIKLKDKLDSIDEALAKGETLLYWPIQKTVITARFHDPTYPFRKLFEHPGTDMRASVGTQVHAAAGGYVAWTKTGKSYGNYMMIVHPGNIATLYAHLSKFIAKPGTYVERGAVIGLSGGMPGQPGAGLSTGPHLHFEVRQDGIPVDPEGYLPAL